MKLKQTIRPILSSALLSPLLYVAFTPSVAYAESLSYNLACQDGSSALTTTEQPAKHQVVVRCKSGAMFTYMNNESEARSKVTGKCPDGENVGTKLAAPNEANKTMTFYCVKGSGEHVSRTNHMPQLTSKEITPPAGTGSDCGGVDTAIIKCDSTGTGLESNAVWKLLIIAINILSAGVGILAVGGIIYASILYTTAEDKQDQINKAKDIIQNVVIGLVAYALMWAGLNFLIPGGLFS